MCKEVGGVKFHNMSAGGAATLEADCLHLLALMDGWLPGHDCRCSYSDFQLFCSIQDALITMAAPFNQQRKGIRPGSFLGKRSSSRFPGPHQVRELGANAETLEAKSARGAAANLQTRRCADALISVFTKATSRTLPLISPLYF